MRHNHSLYLLLLLASLVSGSGRGTAAVDAKKAALSIVRISTADSRGAALGAATGFAITASEDTQGADIEIISPYRIFANAASAVVTDSKGKKSQARRITGANDLYDEARFTVDKPTVQPLPIAAGKLSVGSRATILKTDAKGKPSLTEVTIAETTEHGGLTYYTIDRAADESLIGSPLLNQEGQVAGVIQRSADKSSSQTFAIGIEFNQALAITTMSAADPSLRAIRIPKQLPAVKEQAASYLFLLTKNSDDTLSYLANLADFIEEFPNDYFGYTERAAYYVNTARYPEAEADYTKALDLCTDKADIHHAMSTALYGLNQKTSYAKYKDWDLSRALSESDLAYSLSPSPLYLMQRGKCLYAMQRYAEAADTYAQINQTDFCSPENLFCQARSLQMAGADSMQVIALLDSAVMRFPRPWKSDAAPYVLYRAQQCQRYGMYKEAALGYQDYEYIIGTKNLNDIFFFNKAEAELRCKLYPQALNDIEKAIALNNREYVYHIEKALIETRTGHFEEAIYTATQAQKLDPSDPDSYKLIGISQGELGRKAEARQNLQRAYELGDAEALEWLNNMK